ncbi:MAG: RNA polymerase sigma factor [Flavobacteriaceae bacterium]
MTRFLDDDILKAELKKGNQQAVVFLMNTYHKPLCAYVYNLSNDYELAQDIVQNVFVKIWEDRHKIEHVKSIKRYLYKSVYNRLLNHWRDNKKILTVEARHLEELSYFIDSETQESLQNKIEAIKIEIQNLPKKCKETFLLSKQEGLTNIEIAEFMDVSLRTVETQLYKAFKLLRSKLVHK